MTNTKIKIKVTILTKMREKMRFQGKELKDYILLLL